MQHLATPEFATPVQELGQYRAWMHPNAVIDPIDLVWVSIAPAVNPKPHWMLPHGEPSIAIRRTRDSQGNIATVDLIVCGPYSFGAVYTPIPTEELIAVRLKPESSASAFAIAPIDYLDQEPVTAPPSLQRACQKALKVAECSTIPKVISVLSDDLVRLGRQVEPAYSPERRAAELLRLFHGGMRCSDIAMQLGISERHLRRRFRDHLGCTPKTYADQLRLTAAALSAEKFETPNWAHTALQAGFHDQPHMNNAFRNALGVSPREFHRERRALSNIS